VDKRAYRYILPYWRRLTVVLAISVASTALSLYLPYLTGPLVDVALVGKNAAALQNFVVIFIAIGAASFVLSVVSGLQYTRVSAEILFDMRRDLYEHLQRLSPRFYATARLGDVVSRLNNDIGEIQRVAAETALAWVGNVLFLAGSLAILLWLDWRLCLVGLATLPVSAWMLAVYRRRLERRVTGLRERSADLGSFLIETLPAMRTVVTSGAERREVERFSRLNDAFIATLMGVQRVQYRPAVAAHRHRHGRSLLLRRLARHRRHAHPRDPGPVSRVSGARGRAGAGVDGPVWRAGDGARVLAARGGAPQHTRRSHRSAGRAGVDDRGGRGGIR
jgi:ATP-binding cassette subfamily B protein